MVVIGGVGVEVGAARLHHDLTEALARVQRDVRDAERVTGRTRAPDRLG